MIKIVTGIATIFAMIMLSCNSPGLPDIGGGLSGEKIFWAQKVTDGSWYQVGANMIASGPHIEVYADTTSGVTATTGDAIVTEYEANIYGLMLTNFGGNLDVDGNGKITLLLLNIIDGFSGSGGYVAGYFDSTHELSTASNPHSNQKDMLFMDTYPAVPGSTGFNQTIAHELQHLINFSYATTNSLPEEDLWINEGLSTAAEQLYDSADTSRVDYYNYVPAGYNASTAAGATTIMQGNNFFVWNGKWEGSPYYDVLADYSTDYLFFQWLRIQSNGTAIYKDILQSTSRNYQAVTSAASSRINASFSSWDTLLSTWLLANYRNESTGYKGYKGQITTVPHRMISNSLPSPWSFAPGEGFVKSVSGASFTDPLTGGPNIKYIGITDGTGALDTTGTGYNGGSLLAYNNNTLLTDPAQNGPLPTSSFVASSLSSTSLFPARSALPTIYSISINLAPGGGFAPYSHRVPPLSLGPELSKNAKN